MLQAGRAWRCHPAMTVGAPVPPEGAALDSTALVAWRCRKSLWRDRDLLPTPAGQGAIALLELAIPTGACRSSWPGEEGSKRIHREGKVMEAGIKTSISRCIQSTSTGPRQRRRQVAPSGLQATRRQAGQGGARCIYATLRQRPLLGHDSAELQLVFRLSHHFVQAVPGAAAAASCSPPVCKAGEAPAGRQRVRVHRAWGGRPTPRPCGCSPQQPSLTWLGRLLRLLLHLC